MFTFDKRLDRRTCLVYLGLSALAGCFSAVYESLSHGVISMYMVFLFAWPLLGGALPFAMLSAARKKPTIGWLARCLYHSGVATLTVGSCVLGVLEIYGTTSDYVTVYWIVGAALIACGVGLALWGSRRKERIRA